MFIEAYYNGSIEFVEVNVDELNAQNGQRKAQESEFELDQQIEIVKVKKKILVYSLNQGRLSVKKTY